MYGNSSDNDSRVWKRGLTLKQYGTWRTWEYVRGGTAWRLGEVADQSPSGSAIMWDHEDTSLQLIWIRAFLKRSRLQLWKFAVTLCSPMSSLKEPLTWLMRDL